MIRLTDAQIYTLRRIKSGVVHLVLFDGTRGIERRGLGYKSHDVNCPSLPVLLRLGCVEFKNEGCKEKGKWYYIQLTDLGVEAVKTLTPRG